MNSWPDLDRFLRTDPRDAGCGPAMELLHVYAELAVADPGAAERRYPEVAAHLRACGPCEVDLNGLLAAIQADLQILRSPDHAGRAVSRPGRPPLSPCPQ